MAVIADLIGSNDLTIGTNGVLHTDDTGSPPVGATALQSTTENAVGGNKTDAPWHLLNNADVTSWIHSGGGSADFGLTVWVRTEANNAAYYAASASLWAMFEQGDFSDWGLLGCYRDSGTTEMAAYNNLENTSNAKAEEILSGNAYVGDWYFIYCGYYSQGTSQAAEISADAGTIHTDNGGNAALRWTGNTDFFMGGFNSARPSMRGYINQLCFWNKRLSAGDLTSLYNTGSGRSLVSGDATNLHAAWLDDGASLEAGGIQPYTMHHISHNL